MDRNLLKKIILGGVFVVAIFIAVLLAGLNHEGEVSYTVLGDSTLPIITLQAEGTEINRLYGYKNAEDISEEMESLTPLDASLKLPVTINVFDNQVTGISYEIRDVAGSNLIEKTVLDSWEVDAGKVKTVLSIKDILEENIEYRLIIKLSTARESSICYFTRIIKNNDFKTKEMLDYVSDFHASTFNVKEAEKYAVNWEVDGTVDDDSLAYVDMHSSFNQLTYDKLEPTQIGDTNITVLEMDEVFGYFKICFEIKTTGEDGEDSYYVEEYYCIQWSELRFYLMSYERHMTENFRPTDATITNSKVEFGVQLKDDIKTFKSPEEKYLAFTISNELWTYSSDNKQITEIFSFNNGQDSIRRANRNYNIKIISISDEGDVDFFVYGYMLRGKHEGENGVSFYKYNNSSNTLDEKLFFPSAMNEEAIAKDIETLCKKVNENIYFLFDDGVYQISNDGKETSKLIEGAYEHKLKVNEEQTAIAWTQGDDETFPDQVQIKYLDNDGSNSVMSSSDDYVLVHGFLEKDIVVSKGKKSDVEVSGLEKIYPQYKVSIIDENGKEVKTYEESGLIFSAIKVGEGKIDIERVKEGSLEKTEDYTIMQNDKELDAKDSLLKNEVLDKKERVFYIDNKHGKGMSDCDVRSPEQVSYYEGVSAASPSDREVFYAYKAGHIKSVYDKASDAILSAYDDFGYVVSSSGHHIWHRRGIGKKEYKIEVPTISAVSAGEEILGALNVILQKEGSDIDAEGLLASGESAEEIIKRANIGAALVLNDCNVKQVAVILEKGSMIIALDGENKAYLLIGHDEYNTTLYDTVTGKTYKKGLKDSAELFGKAGFRMLSYCR